MQMTQLIEQVLHVLWRDKKWRITHTHTHADGLCAAYDKSYKNAEAKEALL